MKNLFKKQRIRAEKVATAAPVADKGVAYSVKKPGKHEYKTCLCINGREVHKVMSLIAYTAEKQMKKYMGIKSAFMLLFIFFITACSSSIDFEEDFTVSQAAPVVYSMEINTTITTIYNICVEVYGESIPENIINDRIETIRFCDLVMDPTGDFVSEIIGYEDIKSILWPKGYGILDC